MDFVSYITDSVLPYFLRYFVDFLTTAPVCYLFYLLVILGVLGYFYTLFNLR